MEAESGSIRANGITVDERWVWRLSERTEKDARERAKISGKSNQLNSSLSFPVHCPYSLKHDKTRLFYLVLHFYYL